MSKEDFIIKSDDGREYAIPDINKFIKHLTDFHTVNGAGNNSLHEENGFYFTVTDVKELDQYGDEVEKRKH